MSPSPSTDDRRAGFQDLLVSQVMHEGLLTCPPEAQVQDLARIMAAHRVHCIAVMGPPDGEHRPVWGIVSDLDVVRLAADGDEANAGEIAGTEVVTVHADARLLDAARLMADHGVNHLVVLEPGADRPIGVVSTLDVAQAMGGIHR